jgi:hypothetical protein
MNTMSETIASTPSDDRPRRQLLGLAVLLVTLGAAYGAAQLDVRGAAEQATLAELAEVEAEDERPVRLTRAEIMAEIETVAARYRVSPRLVAAIVAVESEFNPRAVSRRGAQGLMQLMPATAASVDVQDTFDARENIEGGVRHLRTLMDRYQNDLPLVLAAYNAGDRAVLAYGGVPPYPETRRYVIRVLRRVDPEAARAAARRMAARQPAASAPPRPRPPYEGLATPAVLRVPGPDLPPPHEPQVVRELEPARERWVAAEPTLPRERERPRPVERASRVLMETP